MPHSIPAVTPSDAAAAPSTVPLDSPTLFINRELSWLAFNERVLAQACDAAHPLLERVKFLAIVGTNLDEFFMIRVATLHKQLRTDRDRVSPDGLTTEQQVRLVRRAGAGDARRAGPLLERSAAAGAGGGTASASWSRRLHAGDRAIPGRVLPARDRAGAHAARLRPRPPVPAHLQSAARTWRSSSSTTAGRSSRASSCRHSPAALRAAAGRAVAGERTAFVFLEDVVCANVQSLFPGTTGQGAHMFRVMRDTDMVIQEDEADDLLETIDQGLRQLRHGVPALLQVEERMPRRVLDILVENFEIDDECSSGRRTASGSATGWS